MGGRGGKNIKTSGLLLSFSSSKETERASGQVTGFPLRNRRTLAQRGFFHISALWLCLPTKDVFHSNRLN